MRTQDFISHEKITISLDDRIDPVLQLINKYNYSHIPVTKDNELLGMIACEDLKNLSDTNQLIKDVIYLSETFFGRQGSTIIELLGVFANNNANILPMLDDKNKYVGFLDLDDALAVISETHFLQSEGSVLLLKKSTNDYSISEVAQIVESENNEVIGIYLGYKDAEFVQIVLKIKDININEIIQSFRRYEYEILNDLTEDSYLDGLKNRSEYFIKYLNL